MARQGQVVKVPVQGLEKPFEAGSVCILRDCVAQLAPAAASEGCLWDVGLHQRRGTGCVLRVTGLQNRRLSKKKSQGTARNVNPNIPNLHQLISHLSLSKLF